MADACSTIKPQVGHALPAHPVFNAGCAPGHVFGCPLVQRGLWSFAFIRFVQSATGDFYLEEDTKAALVAQDFLVFYWVVDGPF